jgi:hypothetical protein
MHGIANDKHSGLTQAYLCEVLHYDPEGGHFTWLKDTGKKRMKGKRAGNLCKRYWEIAIGGRQYKAHRLAWLYVHGQWPANDIDHINGDHLDNRIANLRPATRSQNNMNNEGRTTKSSVRRGVSWHSQMNKWRAYITVDLKQISLGLFDKQEDAIAARLAAEKSFFGDFVRVV